jgi:hypothetical protein
VSSFNLPKDLFQFLEFIGSYSIMVDVLLGIYSPPLVALMGLYDFLFVHINAVRSAVPDDQLLMFMARILPYIQIISINYINAKLNLQVQFVADPSFLPIVSAIQNRMFNQFPNIPARYIADIKKAAGKGTNSPAPPHSSSGEPKTKSTPSTTRAPKGGMDPDSVQVRANPSDVVTAWTQAFAASPKTIRILRTIPYDQQPVSTDPATKICISWHGKGSCYSKCMNLLDGKSASTRILDGRQLADRGTLVVTINFRLNTLRFLVGSRDGMYGNLGVMDQSAALHWVKENIVNFGGDPDDVTLFGESAGAIMTVLHLLMEKRNTNVNTSS